MFEIPENLAPETYPMAWLVGTWRGYGSIGYPGIEQAPMICEIEVFNNGGPYLTVNGTWYLANESIEKVDMELPGDQGVAQLTEERLWQAFTGFLRQSPEKEGELEAMIASPDGRATLFVGVVKAPRMNLVSDTIVRSATGAHVDASQLQVAMVDSDLLFAYDMSAFGEEMQSYAAGRLSKVRENN